MTKQHNNTRLTPQQKQSYMLRALKTAEFKEYTEEPTGWAAFIPQCQGVIVEAPAKNGCIALLRSALSEWIALRQDVGYPLPELTKTPRQYKPPLKPKGDFYSTAEVLLLINRSQEQLRTIVKHKLLTPFRIPCAGNVCFYKKKEVEELAKHLNNTFG